MDQTYTPDEIATITRLHDIERLSWNAIAERIGGGRTATLIRKRYERSTLRATPQVTVERNCLRCGGPFPSEGAHNRMCDPCRGKFNPVMHTIR